MLLIKAGDVETNSGQTMQASLDLRYLPQTKADFDKVHQDWTLGAPKMCRYPSGTI